MSADALERFELSLLGGPAERRYRTLRPDVERLPWGTMEHAGLSEKARAQARDGFTVGAFLEHRAAAAAATTVSALVLARAPLDLIGAATRYPLDELTHAELCARMAMELGGALDVRYEPGTLLEAPQGETPILRAAELIVRWFCVGESFSLPLVKAQRDAATVPLARGVFEIMVQDDSHHARFGWDVLDWALAERREVRTRRARARLGEVATAAAAACVCDLDPEESRRNEPALVSLGLIDPADYSRRSRKSLTSRVIEPFRARGIPCDRPAGW